MRAALDGVDVVFLMPAAESADRVQQHQTAVSAAVAARGEAACLPVIDRSGRRGDVHARTRPLAHRAVHPPDGFGLDVFDDEPLHGLRPVDVRRRWGYPRALAGDGWLGRLSCAMTLPLPQPQPRCSPPGHDARIYELTGPEAFTMAQAAEAISRAGGRRISFEDETDAEAFASRSGTGAPEWECADGLAPNGRFETAVSPRSATTSLGSPASPRHHSRTTSKKTSDGRC